MKNTVIDHVVDSFVDFAGKERKFIVVAISSPHDLYARTITIGVSICNSDDEFDEKIGIDQAIKNAKTSNIKMFATCNGMVTTNIVRTLLVQECAYFKENPASHIPGYNQMQRKYNKLVNAAQKINLAKKALDPELVNKLDKLNPKEIELLKSILNEQ